MLNQKRILAVLIATALMLAAGTLIRQNVLSAGVVTTHMATMAAGEPVIGFPFPIDTGPGDQIHPAVAYNSQRGQFLVAYEPSPGVVTIVRLTLQGNIIFHTPPLAILFTGERPALAYNSAADEYLLVWQELKGKNTIKAARINGEGTPVGNVIVISPSGGDQKKPSVAFNKHGSYENYLVVWEDENTSWIPKHWEVWGQRVAGTQGAGDSGGELVGGNFMIAGGSWNYEPDVAYNLNRNEYMVVYTRDTSSGGNPNAMDIIGRRVTGPTGPGQLLAEHAIDDAGMSQHQPAVGAYRLNPTTPYLVVYTDRSTPQGSVWGRLVDGDGNPAPSFLNIAADLGRPEQEPDIASSEELGGYTVVWSQYDGDWDVHSRRVSDTGAMEPAFNISMFGFVVIGCDEQVPAVAGGSPVAMAIWQDSCFGAGGWDIVGRILGYGVHLPLIRR